MATTPTFTFAFAQNMQQQLLNAQFFDNLVMMSVTAVAMLKGGQMVHYVYNQARRLWQTQEAQPRSSDSSTGGRSIRRVLRFEDIVFTPQPPAQQGQAQGPVIRRVIRLEVGQQFLPVNNSDDHDNYDHNDNHDDHDREKADSSAVAALERVHRRKGVRARQTLETHGTTTAATLGRRRSRT